MENKYNAATYKAISYKFIECSKLMKQKKDELAIITDRLDNSIETMYHQGYLELKGKYDRISQEINDLSVELNTWDKARKICLNVIDEVG